MKWPLLAFFPWISAVAAPGHLDAWRERMRDIVPKSYACGRAETAPVIDGRLDDAAWAAAPWTEDFVDIEGAARPAPRHRTRAKMLWDDRCLYIAAEMEAPHVWATLTEHDSVIFHDPDFEVFLDPDGDSHRYFEFEMNALNTGWDLFLPKPYKNGGQADNGWEIPGLRTAVHVRGSLNDPADVDEGWSVEIALPWRAFPGHGRPAPGDTWRVNFSRVDWQTDVVDGKYVKKPGVPENNWVWTPQGVIDMHRPERWGRVRFDGRAATVPADVTQPVRDALQEIHYAQMDFHGRTGRWAESFEELGLVPAASATVGGFALVRTPAGYDCTAELQQPGAAAQVWSISEDARIRPQDGAVERALEEAGENRPELLKALATAPGDQRASMEFLIANMPAIDLRSLSAAFLLEQVDLAHTALAAAPWGGRIPREIFLNEVLPYASLNETRDAPRRRLRELALPLVEGCKTPSEAAQALNRKLFPLTGVKYSTARKKPDQSSLETLESGLASCSGLSILLVDACRAVGVPARVVGTPLWANQRGNHTWVEIWDGGWHFTGAAEPDDKGLDHGWFTADAAQAVAEVPEHAIYASSFRKTGTSFPLVWDPALDWVPAVNVTDRYTAGKAAAAPAELLVRVLAAADGPRVATEVVLTDPAEPEFRKAGTSRGESADLNDFLRFEVEPGRRYRLAAGAIQRDVTAAAGEVVTLVLPPVQPLPAGD